MTREEYARRRVGGQCVNAGCLEESAPGRTRCAPCAAKVRRAVRRLYVRREGWCRQCGGELDPRSELLCPAHLRAMRVYRRTWRERQAA